MFEEKLPQFIEAPKQYRASRRRRSALLLAGVGLILLLTGRVAISNWVDLLWFQSLGYGAVFWKTFWLQAIAFLVFGGGHLPHPFRHIPDAPAFPPGGLAEIASHYHCGPAGLPVD